MTAGPTREFFDTVRFISNPSTGKMGFAFAEAARDQGHEVELVAGPVELLPPAGVSFTPVVTAEQMFDACCRIFVDCQAAVMTAAVCDYKPSQTFQHKLQKKALAKEITLEPTRDICAHLGAQKEQRIVIGFAMEDHDHRAHAEAKLVAKNCDAIVLNGPENVGTTDAVVEIVTADGRWSNQLRGTKQCISLHLIELIERLHNER